MFPKKVSKQAITIAELAVAILAGLLARWGVDRIAAVLLLADPWRWVLRIIAVLIVIIGVVFLDRWVERYLENSRE